ncbi:MAG: 4Fe-4S binding protein [Anaerolineae bacterium]|nr:4Fe-4S binding protein [Anaerolineae bacterium]
MMDMIKDVVQTMLRFFPFPTQTGLKVVGAPGRDAPVWVTCNFDLTVRRVLRALDGLDGYLLVAPSKGINVWCASGGGMFNAHSVISAVKTSRIEERVDHRTLILPQLAATGVDVAYIEAQTGWGCKFGPVYARDLAAYHAHGEQKTRAMCRVEFPLRDRLEMAVMWAAPLSMITSVVAALFDWRLVPGVLALIWGFSLFLFAGYDAVMHHVPGPVGLVKVLLLGLVGATGVTVWGLGAAGWSVGRVAGWSVGILAVALVLGFDLDGSSPLAAGSTSAFWARRWPGILDVGARLGFKVEAWFELEVDAARCKGCATCVSVCPKGVFELYREEARQRARVSDAGACVLCTACVKQCPEGAVVANPPVKVFLPLPEV